MNRRPTYFLSSGDADFIKGDFGDRRFMVIDSAPEPKRVVDWQKLGLWGAALAINFGLWALIIWGVRALYS